MNAAEALETTDDAALGGRLRLLQPKRGHRFGHDAVLLAAVTAAEPGDHVVEFGAGVGLAGLAVAWRVPEARVTLVEIDEKLAALASENAAHNHLADRIAVVAQDVTQTTWTANVAPADRVLMNPPYNDAARHRGSPDPARASAHMASRDTLAVWCASAARILKPNGTLTMIWRADGLADVLAALSPGFGGVTLLPVRPRPDAAATLILVAAQKGSSAPLVLLPGVALNGADGKPTPEIERVMREGEPLSLAQG